MASPTSGRSPSTRRRRQRFRVNDIRPKLTAPSPGRHVDDTVALYIQDSSQDAGSIVSATVLLVDDEAELRQVMARALEEDGLRVLQAENGLEAWRIFEEFSQAINS